jgi:hypothetical protein
MILSGSILALGMNAVACPETVSTVQSAAPTVGWQADEGSEKSCLSSVKFYFGDPSKKRAIAPAQSSPSGRQHLVVYEFKNRGNEIWLECGYSHTRMKLSRPIPKLIQRCEVLVKPGTGLIHALSCRQPAAGQTGMCSSLDIAFVGTSPKQNGSLLGEFSIVNRGTGAVSFPLEGEDANLIHGRYAITEQRARGESSWQAFNPILEEMYAPTKHLSVDAGQQSSFRFDGNGLFVDIESGAEMEYSIVVTDASGCEYRSAPFSF